MAVIVVLFKLIVGIAVMVAGVSLACWIVARLSDISNVLVAIIGIPLFTIIACISIIGGARYCFSGIADVVNRGEYVYLMEKRNTLQEAVDDITENYKANERIEYLQVTVTELHDYNESTEKFDEFVRSMQGFPEPQFIKDWRGFNNADEAAEALKIQAPEWLVENDDDMMTMLQMELLHGNHNTGK